MCRQVALHSEVDLRTVSVISAKSIIILADPDIPSDASDAQALRTMLTVMAFDSQLNGCAAGWVCNWLAMGQYYVCLNSLSYCVLELSVILCAGTLCYTVCLNSLLYCVLELSS